MEMRTFELGFARFIENFHEQIKDDFLVDAFEKRGLLANLESGRKMLEDLADNICSEFTTNIDRNTSVDQIADRYTALGARCSAEGVSFAEMVQGFILIKRHIWVFFQDSDFAGQPFDVRSIVALNNRTALFFDRAIYYFLTGYEKCQCKGRAGVSQVYESLLNLLRRDLGLPGPPPEEE
jgi:hypothetical protein